LAPNGIIPQNYERITPEARLKREVFIYIDDPRRITKECDGFIDGEFV
jgi:hypothetical protein